LTAIGDIEGALAPFLLNSGWKVVEPRQNYVRNVIADCKFKEINMRNVLLATLFGLTVCTSAMAAQQMSIAVS
jgi:hypothetical protein